MFPETGVEKSDGDEENATGSQVDSTTDDTSTAITTPAVDFINVTATTEVRDSLI